MNRSVQPTARCATTLLLSGAHRISDDERHKLLHGGARCSALQVPFRATPRMIVRPVGQLEVGFLVELSERFAPKMPQQLLRWGFHPRVFASYHTLAILCAHVALLALPSPQMVVLRLGWWLTFLLFAVLGVLVVLRWQVRWARTILNPLLPESFHFFFFVYMEHAPGSCLCSSSQHLQDPHVLPRRVPCRHRPSAAAVAESWIPWTVEQLAKGASEEEVRPTPTYSVTYSAHHTYN